MFLKDEWTAAQGPLWALHQEWWGWDGRDTPAWPPKPLPTFAETDLPVGKRGSGTKGSRGGSKKHQRFLHGWSFGLLGGKRRLWMGSRAGGAQVLLSSSCFLLLWHLNLFPCCNLPPALQRGQTFPGKRKRRAQERSLTVRIHPAGEQRAPHATLPKENQKRHVRTERKPNCWDRQLHTNTPSRWDLTHGGWGRKGAPKPMQNRGPLCGQTKQPGSRAGDGAGWIWSEQVGKSSGKESEAAHNPSQHG